LRCAYALISFINHMVVYCCTTQNKLNGGPTTHNAVGRSEREAVKARGFGMANGRALVGHRRLITDELQIDTDPETDKSPSCSDINACDM